MVQEIRLIVWVLQLQNIDYATLSKHMNHMNVYHTNLFKKVIRRYYIIMSLQGHTNVSGFVDMPVSYSKTLERMYLYSLIQVPRSPWVGIPT